MGRTVEVITGNPLVQLPNGYPAVAGDVVELTDAEFAALSATAFGDVVIDRGENRSVLTDDLREIAMPIDLVEASAGDVPSTVKTVRPGFAGTIRSVVFVATTPATTAAKDIDLAVRVNTGTAAATLTILTASVDADGEQVVSNNITTNNTFDADDDIQVRLTEKTAAFLEGAGVLVITCIPT